MRKSYLIISFLVVLFFSGCNQSIETETLIPEQPELTPPVPPEIPEVPDLEITEPESVPDPDPTLDPDPTPDPGSEVIESESSGNENDVNCVTAGIEVPCPTIVQEFAEFDILAKKWSFDPETIIVSEGDNVILHITSVDVTHGFSLTNFGIIENLKPGETVDVEFVANQKGEFTYSCSVYCGSGHNNMKGKLIVN